MTSLSIESIAIGDRVRKDMGDIKALAESMQKHGLLHPVVITKDNTLVAGHRRIAAAGLLGWEEVPVTVVDVADLLSAEKDENEQRKDFTPSEAVAIGRLIEERERPKAEERRQFATQKATAIRRGLDVGGETSPTKRSHNGVREIAAAAVGMSGQKYDLAKKVVSAAESDPQRFGDLPARMDETGNVYGTHRELERRKPGGNGGRSAIHRKTRHANHTEEMRRAIWTLQGAVKAMASTSIAETDTTERTEWIKALSEARFEIREIMARLKETV